MTLGLQLINVADMPKVPRWKYTNYKYANHPDRVGRTPTKVWLHTCITNGDMCGHVHTHDKPTPATLLCHYYQLSTYTSKRYAKKQEFCDI